MRVVAVSMPERKGEVMMVERDVIVDSLPVKIKVRILREFVESATAVWVSRSQNQRLLILNTNWIPSERFSYKNNNNKKW